MKFSKLALAAAFFVSLANVTAVAHAQTKVFYVDEGKVRQETKVGKEMNAMLANMTNQGIAQLGLADLNKQIADEGKALQPQLQSLTEDAIQANPTLKARVDAFSQKRSEFQQKTSQVNQAVTRSGNELNAMFTYVLDPAVQHVAKQVGADVVLADPNTRYIKESLDITSKVVARLDSTIPTVAALQAALPQQPAAAPAAAPAPKPAAPAAPAATPKPPGAQ
jgi:Skp family chaperone for outer membrane proteins